MIDNLQLKIVASRATWLGNDQTHYEQKYTDNDINDLKRLIKLSVNWIEICFAVFNIVLIIVFNFDISCSFSIYFSIGTELLSTFIL